MPDAAGGTDAAGRRHRIDRWLWFARWYRSRSLASAAVGGGKVHVNGGRARPSRDLAIGDRLDITRGGEIWTVSVRALPARRGPAAEAAACYEETPESRARRELAREHRQAVRASAAAPAARPDKRGRRAIRRLRGRD